MELDIVVKLGRHLVVECNFGGGFLKFICMEFMVVYGWCLW
jgi:hypothetical protein